MLSIPNRACALLLASLAGCGAGGYERSSTPVRPLVAVSVQPQAWFVEQLAGDSVDVMVVIPPRANHEAYQPTMAQMEALSRAQLYIKVGHPAFAVERTWLDGLAADRPDLTVVDGNAGARATPLLGQEGPGAQLLLDDPTTGDPHVWVSPRHARAMTVIIAGALGRLLPAAAADIAARRDRLVAQIGALDQELRSLFAEHRGHFYVFHPAWGYLARDYGLEQVAIEQDGKEPDARTLAALINRARADQVKTLFVQPQMSTHSADVIAGEIGAQVVAIDPMASDWLANLREVARLLAAGVVP